MERRGEGMGGLSDREWREISHWRGKEAARLV